MPRGLGIRKRRGPGVALSPPPEKRKGGRRAVPLPKRTETAAGETRRETPRGQLPEVPVVELEEVQVEDGITGMGIEPEPQMLLNVHDNGYNNSTTPEIEIIPLESDSIGDHVPRAIKQKIWGHEYINLALLLKGYSELNDFCTSAPMVVGSSGMIETRPPTCKEKIPNVEKWTDAFHIYMSIYLERFPAKVQELLQYVKTIRGAACQGVPGGWRVYDEQFRARLSQSPGLAWNQINSNLWLRVMTPQAGGMGKNNVVKGGNKEWGGKHSKPSPCFGFNRGKCTYSNCRYTHVCSICAADHSALQCTKSFRPSAASSSQGKKPHGSVQSGKNPNK